MGHQRHASAKVNNTKDRLIEILDRGERLRIDRENYYITQAGRKTLLNAFS